MPAAVCKLRMPRLEWKIFDGLYPIA
eukprot:SAG31_NODE_43562_length_266_cov_1.209581_1_plen_25_part_01